VPVVLCAVVAAEGLAFILPYWPRIDRDRFYASDPAITFATGHQGLDRVEGFGALWSGATRYYGLRTATGHQYFTDEWLDLLEAVDPYPYRGNRKSFTVLNLDHQRMYSPIRRSWTGSPSSTSSQACRRRSRATSRGRRSPRRSSTRVSRSRWPPLVDRCGG
jgi:hypothetical protein